MLVQLCNAATFGKAQNWLINGEFCQEMFFFTLHCGFSDAPLCTFCSDAPLAYFGALKLHCAHPLKSTGVIFEEEMFRSRLTIDHNLVFEHWFSLF